MESPKRTTFEEHCTDYWRVAKVWNGQSNEPFTTEGAIAITNYLLSSLDPSRTLWGHISNLQYNIIEYGTKRKQKKVPPREGTLLAMFPVVTVTSKLVGVQLKVQITDGVVTGVQVTNGSN